VSEEFIVKVPLADIHTCLFMRSVSIFFFWVSSARNYW